MTQLRRQFIREFGALLQPHGFFLWQENYFRVDSEAELLWIVRMEELEGGPIVTFDLKAFCHALDERAISQSFWQLSAFWRDIAESIDHSLLYKPACQLSACVTALREIVLDRFVAVRTLKDFRLFREWLWGRLGGNPVNFLWDFAEAMECMRCEEYDSARNCLIAAHEKHLDACRKRPFLREQEEIQRREQEILRLLKRVDEEDYATLREILEQRVEFSRQSIHRFFGGSVSF